MFKFYFFVMIVLIMFSTVYCKNLKNYKYKLEGVLLNNPLDKVVITKHAVLVPSVSLKRSSSGYSSNVEPNPVGCASFKLSEEREKIRCKPRPTIVSIVNETFQFIPDVVLVKRCGGFCHKQECVSTKTVLKHFYVSTVDDISKGTCFKIAVSEDKACKCRCVPKQCPNRQKFDKKACKCVCNEDERKKCSKWNSTLCLCENTIQQICTTGTIYDAMLKRCVRY